MIDDIIYHDCLHDEYPAAGETKVKESAEASSSVHGVAHPEILQENKSARRRRGVCGIRIVKEWRKFDRNTKGKLARSFVRHD